MDFASNNKQKFLIFSKLVCAQLNFANERIKILYENISRYYDNHLEEDRNNMLSEIENDFKDLAADDKEWLVQDISDWEYLSRDSLSILTHLMIVGLYSNYEKSLKKILKKSNLLTDAQLDSLTWWNHMHNLLNSLGIIYSDESDNNFVLVDETRLLNNCIKHKGKVNDLLAVRNSHFWTEGDEIGDLAEHFIRLKDAPVQYLESLSVKNI